MLILVGAILYFFRPQRSAPAVELVEAWRGDRYFALFPPNDTLRAIPSGRRVGCMPPDQAIKNNLFYEHPSLFFSKMEGPKAQYERELGVLEKMSGELNQIRGGIASGSAIKKFFFKEDHRQLDALTACSSLEDYQKFSSFIYDKLYKANQEFYRMFSKYQSVCWPELSHFLKKISKFHQQIDRILASGIAEDRRELPGIFQRMLQTISQWEAPSTALQDRGSLERYERMKDQLGFVVSALKTHIDDLILVSDMVENCQNDSADHTQAAIEKIQMWMSEPQKLGKALCNPRMIEKLEAYIRASQQLLSQLPEPLTASLKAKLRQLSKVIKKDACHTEIEKVFSEISQEITHLIEGFSQKEQSVTPSLESWEMLQMMLQTMQGANPQQVSITDYFAGVRGVKAQEYHREPTCERRPQYGRR